MPLRSVTGWEQITNKRPMGHTAHLRNQFKSMNIYHWWGEKKQNWMVLRFFIWTNFHSLHSFCHVWFNWPGGSGEKDFKVLSIYFLYLVIISPWKRTWPFIWPKFNSLQPGMICAKFGWNRNIGSGKEDENVKSSWRRTTDKLWPKRDKRFKIKC